MRSREVALGRTFLVAFDHGEDFYSALDEFCCLHQVRQGFIPSFIAGFSEVSLVGTCQKLDNPAAPVWTSVELSNVEAIGAGTLAYDPIENRIAPHIHVAVGLKQHSAVAHASHLLNATVQFLTEMPIVEVAAPKLLRRRCNDLFDVPLLHFETSAR